MKKLYFLLFLCPFIALSQSAGDIIITEIMQNPSAVGDSSGEWFEVYNTTGSSIDMNGWTVKDLGSNTFTIGSSVVVPAGGYVVFGINGDSGTNGGVTVDYVYPSGFALGNSDDEIILETAGALEIDRVAYDGGPNFPDPNGASMSLNPSNLNGTDNDTGSNWCEGTAAYGAGDLGTPGAANSACGPTCTTSLDAHNTVCDAETAGVDTYTATLNFSGGNVGTTFTVSSTSGVVGGDNPSTVASGTITVTGINEGTDITITVDDTGGGGICNLSRFISSPTCVPATCPSVGDIVITEIMQNPSAVSDNNGEYFEVYNTTGSPIDLLGWVISDNGSESHTIGTSTVVPAMGYAILGRDANSGTNGGVTVDYEYSNFFLGNSDDEVILTCSSTVIDQVFYDGGPNFPDPTGASMELNAAALNATANDTGSNWGEATTTYGAGDSGTPGSANSLSVGKNEIEGFNLYPNPTSRNFVTIESNSHEVMKVKVFDILGKQVIEQRISDNRLNVNSLTPGVYIMRVEQGNALATRKLVVN